MNLKAIILLISLFGMQTVWAACELPLKGTGLCVQIQWESGPNFDEYETLRVSYYKEGGPDSEFFDPTKEIIVYSWMVMGGHEHGSAPTKVTRVEKGVYDISNLYFMSGMGGQWQVRFRIKGTDPKKDYLALIVVEL